MKGGGKDNSPEIHEDYEHPGASGIIQTVFNM